MSNSAHRMMRRRAVANRHYPENVRHDWHACGASTMPMGHMYFKVQMRRNITNGGLTLCQHTVRDRNDRYLTQSDDLETRRLPTPAAAILQKA